jgi:hypothetical protein
MPSSELDEIRRENGRRLIQKHGQGNIAELLGHASSSTLSQIFGPKPTRAPTEKMVRKMEQALGLPDRSLDESNAPPAASPESTETVIRLVGAVVDSESVTLSGTKFSSLALWALQDAKDHGGQPREECIRSVVKLLK